MKKIFVIATLSVMVFSGSAFAVNLDGLAGLVSLSVGVQGNYFPNTTSGNATDFVMSTGHDQGNQVYATGSFTTSIWRKSLTAVFSSADLLGAPSGSSVDTTIFSGASPAYSEM